jgi:hypothetical protein
MRSPRPVVDFPLARRAMAGAEPGIGGGACNVYMSIYNIRDREREGGVDFFSRMRSEGFSFYFGGLGVGTRSLDAAFTSATTLRNRPQPFATVCDEVAMAVPMGRAAKVVTFGGYKLLATSFQWHFVTCPSSFCVAGAAL